MSFAVSGKRDRTVAEKVCRIKGNFVGCCSCLYCFNSFIHLMFPCWLMLWYLCPISIFHPLPFPNAFIFQELFFTATCSCPPCGSYGLGGLALFTCYPLFSYSYFPVLSSHPHCFVHQLFSPKSSYLLLWVEPFPSPELPTSPQFSQSFQFLSLSYIFSFSCLSFYLFWYVSACNTVYFVL